MPLLRNELEQYLRQCFNDLSSPWSDYLQCVTPALDGIDSGALLDQEAQIIPCLQGGHGALFPLSNLDPADVALVIIGQEPYADPLRATGRAFEQGNLTNWSDNLEEPNRITPSLLNLISAVAALHPCAATLELDRADLHNRRQILREFLANHPVLRPPHTMFDNLTEQGVLWLNRTPTISSRPIAPRRRGSSWECIEQHNRWHRALWAPVLCATLSRLIDEALTRPIVFALLGNESSKLLSCINARQQWREVPPNNIRLVFSGHPRRAGTFFANGNPFSRINNELQGQHSIDWFLNAT